jgi:hypothetical protein
LFAYCYDDLRDQQLLVLGNFPETVEPDIYEKLLPKIELDFNYILNTLIETLTLITINNKKKWESGFV